MLLSFCFNLSVQSEVHLADLIDENAAVPVGYGQDAHLVQKCDSQKTKRRAHMFTAISDQKRLDNEWKMYRLQASVRTVTEVVGYDEQGRQLTRTTTEPTAVTSTVLEREEDKWNETGSKLSNFLSIPLMLYSFKTFR